jgi:hypothetical protein
MERAIALGGMIRVFKLSGREVVLRRKKSLPAQDGRNIGYENP